MIALRRAGACISTVLLVLALLSVAAFEAQARRLDGGKSLGSQPSVATRRYAAPSGAKKLLVEFSKRQAAAARVANDLPRGRSSRDIWAGLAAGLGVAWLVNVLGLGPAFSGLLSAVFLALVVAVLWLILRRTMAGAAGGQPAYQAEKRPGRPSQYDPTSVGNDASARPWEDWVHQMNETESANGSAVDELPLGGSQRLDVPHDFDVHSFTEAAKKHFTELQEAWDRGDVLTLRAMMTEEMIASIEQQLTERDREQGHQPNKTDVVMLDMQLLGIEELSDVYMVSVEFSGVIHEDESAGPGPFREVWNMVKPRHGVGGWLVAGVQALQ